MNKLYLFSVVIIASFRGYRFDCKMSEEDLDNCMLKALFFGSENPIVPANDGEMNQHCDTIKSGVTCMKEYSETCLKGFPQKVSGMVLGNLAGHMDKRCNNAKDRSEFIENVKCFLPKEKMKPLWVCSHKHVKHLEIASTMGKDEHTPGACCAYHSFRHCIIDEIKKLCGDGHSQYWDEIFDEVGSEAMAFACAEYDSKSNCAKLIHPDHWVEFTKIDEATDPAVYSHHYKTPIKFIMDMIKKFHMD